MNQTSGLYAGPGVYPGPGFYPKFYNNLSITVNRFGAKETYSSWYWYYKAKQYY